MKLASTVLTSSNDIINVYNQLQINRSPFTHVLANANEIDTYPMASLEDAKFYRNAINKLKKIKSMLDERNL